MIVVHHSTIASIIVTKLGDLKAARGGGGGTEALFAIVELKGLKVDVDLLHHFDPSISLRVLVYGLVRRHLNKIG